MLGHAVKPTRLVLFVLNMRRYCALLLGIFAFLKAASPQQPPSLPPDFRLRISVNLVQVDATVTDSRGKPVSGLTRDDFQILLDGAPQRITFCNFIDAGRPPAPSAPPRSASNKLEAVPPGMPATSLKREDVRRIVVLFVDDLSMSSESVPAVRNGLRKFIEKQLRPGDLVAIVRASAGLGALQDFTTDPQRLLAAAAEVRWKSCGEGGAQAYKPIGINPTEDALLSTSLGQADTRGSINVCTTAATSSLWKLLHGMADLPGRKSVVILADNLPLGSPNEIDPSNEEIPGTGMEGPILASMRRVVDESVRAGVVLYAIDTRGLNSLRAQASDNLRPVSPLATPTFPSAPSDQTGGNWIGDKIQARRDEYREGQWGSLFLASQTGGFMVTEANFIDAAIERVMNDQNGYYLLAFVPPPEALAPGRNGKPVYRRLRVQVLRPGLHVRSHQGFFGVTDQDRVAVSPRPELQLAAALESPFQSSGVGIEIQSGFLNARKNFSFIRTAIVLDGRDLALAGPPIHRSGLIHLLVRAFDVNGGQLEGGINQVLRIGLDEDGYERALKYGLIYTALLPAAKPGPYQIRAACRDETTGKIGTAGDFVVIPKLRGLTLSGIVFQRSMGIENELVPSAGSSSYVPGERAEFAFQLINAPHAKELKTRSLIVRTRLFRDGAQVYESPAIAITPGAATAGRLFNHGSLEIPADLAPGEYLMRVEVEEAGSQASHGRAWQWARLSIRAASATP